MQGVRSVLAATLRKQRRESPEKLTRLQRWIVVLNGRIGYHNTLVAIANKHAWQLWAVLAKGESYNPTGLATGLSTTEQWQLHVSDREQIRPTSREPG